MLKNLRIRLTLLYLGFSFLFLLILGAGLYFFLYRYFQTTTDRALQFRLVQQLEFLGLPVPEDLAEVKFVWLGEADGEERPFQLFTPLPTLLPQSLRTPLPGEDDLDEHGEDDSEEHDRRPTPAPTLSGAEGYGSTGFRGESGEILHDYDGELSSIFFMQVNPSGELIQAEGMIAPPIAPLIREDNLPDPGRFTLITVQDPGGSRYRLLTFSLPPGAPARYFQFGRPIADQSRLLREYLMGLILVGLASLVMMGVGSWVVAGRSIRPAQKALERQQEFVANASHELRTPLTLIRGTAELAGRGARDQAMKTALAEIIEDTDSMSAMVEDLLLLSRIDAGTLKFDVHTIELRGILEEIAEKCGKLPAQSCASVRVEGGETCALADGLRLRQVLWILVDNALQYSEDCGEIVLTVAGEGNTARITVRDHGRGIAEKDIARVFDRFYQAGENAGQRGAGLGLSLAKSLVEGMGGRIEIASVAGEGTQVSIFLNRA